MSRSGDVVVSRRFACLLAFVAGGYASAPVFDLFEYALVVAASAFPISYYQFVDPIPQLLPFMVPALEGLVLACVMLVLGWCAPRGILFIWLLIGFLVCRVTNVLIGFSIMIAQSFEFALPGRFIAGGAVQVILIVGLPLLALFLARWLRHRSKQSDPEPDSFEVSA